MSAPSLSDVQTTIATVAERVGPSLVAVAGGRGWWTGTGVVVGAGQVLTAAHHLRGGAPTVVLPGGASSTATLLGADLDADLAVLGVDTGAAPAVAWATDLPSLGAPVLALAHTGVRGP